MAQSQGQHTLRGNKFATRDVEVARGTRLSVAMAGAEAGSDSDKASLTALLQGHRIKINERSGDLRKAFDGSRKTALQT